MNLVIIDCYDSFTYNLVHYLEQMASSVTCIRNDMVDVNSLGKFDGIIFSPGPGLPEETTNLFEIIAKWGSTKPILGICLGHQAIGTYFGLELINMPKVQHGIDLPTLITMANEPLFNGIPTEFQSARYHSWVLGKPEELSELEITAIDTDGKVMALRHRFYNLRGVQFHPESILTEHGYTILQNWVDSIGR